jgi:outer membrane immunogenic protein
MRTTVIAAAALVVGFSGAAMAQSNDVAFNGPYAGVQVYDSYKNDVDLGFGDSVDLGGQGFEGGIFAGYNHRAGANTVIGIEGQLSYSDADNDTVLGGDAFSTGARESYGVTAKAGYVLGDSTLAYVHGGWTQTKFKTRDVFGSDSTRLDGWKVGAGVETFVAQNVSLRAEYAYTDYQNKDGIEPKNSSFQVGLGFHF